MGYELGVDLGTTYTAAAILRDGRTEIVTLGTRSLQIPSVAFLRENGELLVGEAAERRSLLQPNRFAREFKRRIGDPTPILLGGSPFSAHALTARLLRAVVALVADREGGPPDHVVVTCPASWSDFKRDLLEQAIRQADVSPAWVATEPEAAAVHYASTTRVAPGDVVAVYDLGGGTFDATVLRNTGGRFELIGEPQGIEHLGGVQFDDAVFGHVTSQFEYELGRLDPHDPATLTALARLRRECVEAKEALSADTEVTIPVALPNRQTEVRLTRMEFEGMIRPALADTIDTMVRTLRSADLQPSDVTAVLLVGGSSRIPLIAELVASELRRPTAVDIHPKHAVAMGAARLARGTTATPVAPAAPGAGGAEPPPPPRVPVPFPGAPLPPAPDLRPPPPSTPSGPPEPGPPAVPPPPPSTPTPFPGAPPVPATPEAEQEATGPEPGAPAPDAPAAEAAAAPPEAEAPPEPAPGPPPEPATASPAPGAREDAESPAPDVDLDATTAATEAPLREPEPQPGEPQPPVPEPQPPEPQPPVPEPVPPQPPVPEPEPEPPVPEPEPVEPVPPSPVPEPVPSGERPAVAPPPEPMPEPAPAPPGVPSGERPAEPSGRPRPAVLVAGGVAAVVALVGAVTLLAGGDGGGSTSSGAPCEPAAQARGGGEVVDASTFPGGVSDELGPGETVSNASWQLVNAVYDGLTDVDPRDPADPRVVPLVAASYGANEDATVWRFTLRQGLRFSNGEPVLPSSFVRGWEQASDPDTGSHDAFLFNLLEGGAEKLAGEAETISGVRADDEGLTLEVQLAEPHADFDAVVAYQPFMPLPEAAEGVDPGAWDEQVMVGNGPFVMTRSPTDEGVTLARNPEWNGTCYGESLGLPAQPALERITLQAPGSGGASGYDAFTSGDAHVARVPTVDLGEAETTYENAFRSPLMASTYLVVNWEDPVVGGPENRALRRAIVQAIDRDAINDQLFAGTVTPSTGIAPPIVPGFTEDVCDVCAHDADAARAAYQEWQDEGNVLTEPIRIMSHAGPGNSDPTIDAIVDDLEQAGITAVEEPLQRDEFMPTIRAGGCQLCIVTAYPSFLGYDTFLYDLFHSEAVEYNNFGRFSVEAVDDAIDAARATASPDEQADRYRSAERQLLGDEVAAIPLYWSGQPFVHSDEVASLPVNPLGLIAWERVSLRD